MRVALIHDYIVQYGGAERVLEEFSNLFPHAPIYTLVYDAKASGYAFEKREIRTSFLQKIPNLAKNYRFFPLLMPLAIERFNLSQYDLVISSSASFAKGILTSEETVHISYCHTPMRYAWFDYRKITGDSLYPSMVSKAIPFILPYIRMWDRQSSQRPDYYLANSENIKRKIEKYYDREAAVMRPPVNFHKFWVGNPKNYFLMVGRLVPYKRFDVAIRAFNELGWPLKIIGVGPEYENLKSMAGDNIEFLGQVSESQLSRYYRESRALIFPQEEDFGITALESMASGRPVIAYRGGGALENIWEGVNGTFFEEQTPQSLVKALRRFSKMSFDSHVIRDCAAGYDRSRFRAKLSEFIETSLKEHHKLVRT